MSTLIYVLTSIFELIFLIFCSYLLLKIILTKWNQYRSKHERSLNKLQSFSTIKPDLPNLSKFESNTNTQMTMQTTDEPTTKETSQISSGNSGNQSPTLTPKSPEPKTPSRQKIKPIFSV